MWANYLFFALILLFFLLYNLSTINPAIQEHEFYIAFMPNKDKDNRKCRIDELGRCKFSIAEIWNDFCPDIKTDTNVKLDYVESIGDADIFKLSR